MSAVYTKKQLRRYFQELGLDPNVIGYELLLLAFEIALKNPDEVLYGENMSLMYDEILEIWPSLNRNKIRKNIESMINKWWDNSNVNHPLKERIMRINVSTQFGIHVMMAFMRDDLLSREDEIKE